MEMAKSLFGSRDHEGYVGREEHSVSKIKKNCNFLEYKINSGAM